MPGGGHTDDFGDTVHSACCVAYKPSAGKNLRSFLSHTLNERSFCQVKWLDM